MQRGEIWFASTPGGELELTVDEDGVPSDCVVNFDNIHTIRRDSFRRFIATISPARMAEACQRLRDATGC
jgi:mRNA interferase MazF